MSKSKTIFTPEEEARIQAEVKKNQQRSREIMIQEEIRNRTLLAERNKPGNCYY